MLYLASYVWVGNLLLVPGPGTPDPPCGRLLIFTLSFLALPIPFIAASWQRLYIIQMRDFHGPVGKKSQYLEFVPPINITNNT